MLPSQSVQRASWNRALTPVGEPGYADTCPLREFDHIGTTSMVPRNKEIYGQGEPADFIYKVISGAVRTSRLLADGRRQIGGIHMSGDLFGLEMGASDLHALSAEAVSDARVLAVKRTAAIALAAGDSRFASELWNQAARDLGRAAGHMMLLGRKSAKERVAAFLIEMSERVDGAVVIDLPVCRQDIADYLGLTVETVSRAFSHLEDDGIVALRTARRIELVDLESLELMAG